MKKTIPVLMFVIVLLFITGCEEGISIPDRIQMFEDDLNAASRDGIWDNFHPTATNDYQAIRNIGYWTSDIWVNSNWDFGSPTVVGTNAVIVGTHSGFTPVSLTFEMTPSGSGTAIKWYIAKIRYTSGEYIIDNITR